MTATTKEAPAKATLTKPSDREIRVEQLNHPGSEHGGPARLLHQQQQVVAVGAGRQAGEVLAELLGMPERGRTDAPSPAAEMSLMNGDVLILCSDGLSGQVRANEIADIVSTSPDLVDVCKRLIDLANENGGPDNITVVAARFEGEGLKTAGAETLAHRVYRGSQERPTVPMDRSSIPQLSAIDDDDEQAEIPTLETPAYKERVVVGKAGDGPTVEIAPSVRAKLPEPPPPGGRISTTTLRLTFGAIAAVVAAVVIFAWISRS